MAIAVGSKLLSSDMQSWYTRLNTIIGNYGGGMAKLTVPAAGKRAEPSDVNNVVTKLNAMKSDAYLGSVPSMYTSYTTVSTGQIIRASVGLQLNTVIGNLEAIKCRNTATNYNGVATSNRGHGNSHGTNQHGDNYGTHQNGDNYGTHQNGNNHGTNSHGDNHGTNGNGNNHGTNSNGNNHGTNGNGTCQNGAKSFDRKFVSGNYFSNTCTFWCSQGTNSNGTYSSTYGNGTYSSSYGNGTYSSRYGNGTYSSRYGNQTYSSRYGNQTYSSRYGNGTYSSVNTNGTNSQGTRTNGTIIEVRNAQTTKSNG